MADADQARAGLGMNVTIQRSQVTRKAIIDNNLGKLSQEFVARS